MVSAWSVWVEVATVQALVEPGATLADARRLLGCRPLLVNSWGLGLARRALPCSCRRWTGPSTTMTKGEEVGRARVGLRISGGP